MTDELCSAVERTEEEKRRRRRKGEKKKEKKTEKETNLSPRATWASVRIRIIRTRADADAHGNIPGKQLDAVTPFVLKTFTVVLVVAALKLAASRGNFRRGRQEALAQIGAAMNSDGRMDGCAAHAREKCIDTAEEG